MYEKQILDAIQTLVDNAIDNAKFDKTIKGIISKCVDEKNGKYVVIYQDSSFYAYSNDTTQIYNAGTQVYVLIPGNDMTQTKTILGSVNKLGSDYINSIEENNRYDIIGNNIVNFGDNEVGICSYKEGGDVCILYNKINNTSNNLIDIDTTAANTYIKQANYLSLGGIFKTNLNREQKYKGNYGLGFDLNFTDNMTGETVKRTYLIDINSMTGNPYEYTKATEQKKVFNIDGKNFIDIDKIYLFGYDFPNSSMEEKPNDIFVLDVSIEAAELLSNDELSGNKLTLITPQGIYFDIQDSSESIRTIKTEIKIDNKIINSDSSSLKYYWFKENYAINQSSLLYNRYGGNSWECLNNKNIVERDGNGNPILVDWITNESTYTIKKSDIVSRTTDYKCVVIYNNEIILTKKITVYNYSSNYIVSVNSDSGVYFSYDNGNPTLTCNVNIDGNYMYKWGIIDNGNNFTSIEETIQTNLEYHTIENRYLEIENGLNNGTILLTAAIQQELEQLRYSLEQYNSIMRVEGNTIYNLKLNMITNFATFVCAVYDNNNDYIGKGSLKIENDLNTNDNSYTLIINHGDQVFKYNEDGISPTSKSLENPQAIYPLSFTLYDEKGIEINNEAINAKDVFWTVPTDNTMIKVSAIHGNPISKDDFNRTETYTEYKEFFFDIPILYNGNKTRNTIQLKIKYKNKIIVTNTELLFLKEGESGSNGTDFVCRIVPNTIDGQDAPLYPIVTYDNNAILSTNNPTINFIPRNENVWFKVQFYHNGSEIFDGVTSGTTTENKNISIQWEMMTNKYDNTHEDISNFSVDSDAGIFSYENWDDLADETLKSNPANIVKCTLTYDGVDYIATMPIILVKVNNSATAAYKMSLNDNTGFRYAMYTTDGRKPIYDNSNPFSLKVMQTIENIDYDISTTILTDYAINYNWMVKGLIYTNHWQNQENLILDTIRSRALERNEIYYKPIDEFNGLCLNNALYCEIKRDNSTLATIHIPIHLYLNRYGNAAMNSWDGNSISINEDGGTILAPQVGAGQKENDNSFTGVFMGTVAEAGSGETETGLFGYNSGARTLELNAKDGSARFGKKGQGQIVIDPGVDESKLYSDGYQIIYLRPSDAGQTKYLGGYTYFAKDNGTNKYYWLKPNVDYIVGNDIPSGNWTWNEKTVTTWLWDTSANTEGRGLEIDLNDPHIRFGNGKFHVEKDGSVYAAGFATVAELEAGDINIPGVENFKIEYATDRVEFTTDSTLTPIDTTLTKSIVGKCLYKDNYVSGYTIQLVDENGDPITHDQSSDGIGISTSVIGQNFTISFNAQSQYSWDNAVNNYYFKFSYTPIGSTIQTLTKIFSANAVMIGADGRSITSAIVEYQAGSSATAAPVGNWSSNPVDPAAGEYLWTRTTINYNTGNPTITYSVSYKAQNGLNGASSYTHIKYSINSTGNPMVDAPTNETKYIGICINNNSTAPSTYTSYTWSKYVGENGKGIDSITNYYLAYASNTGVTTSTSGWTQQIQNVSKSKPYLWNYETVSYNDNTSIDTTPAVIGMYSEDGSNGRGISSIEEYYAINNTETAPTDASFSTTVVSPTADNKYLWNYEKIIYDDSSTPHKTEKRIIGTYGKDGRGISSTTITYASSTQGTQSSQVTGWQASIPSVSPGRYLWTRAVITYNDNTTSTSYSVALMGNTGAQGPAGPAGKDGTSVTIKGSYNTLNELIAAHPSGNTLGDGYIVDLDLYIFTNAAGGGGAQAGDWEDVGQFKGFDAKLCFITATTEIFKSTDGGITFTPSTTTITPTFQAASFLDWAYSSNGGDTWTILAGSESGVSIDNNSKALTINVSTFTPFSSSSVLTFRCRTDETDDNNNPIEDTISISKIIDGIDGTGVWTTTVAPKTPNYTFTISNLVGMNRNPKVGDVIVYSYYRYTITSVSETTVLAGTRVSIRGSSGAAAYTVVLSNEAHTFAATDTHATGETIIITPSVLKGTAAQTTYTIGEITGTISGKLTATVSSTTPYTITVVATNTLDVQSGTLTIPITIDSNTFNKTFSWSLAKAGTDGTSPTAYNLIVSHAAIVKTKNNTYSPTTLTFSATSQTGNAAIQTYTGGSYRITKDGGTAGAWTNLSSSNTYNISTNTPTTSIKIELAKENASSSTHTIVDYQTIPITYDGIDGTDGTSPYNAILTNESQVIAGDTTKAFETTITTNVIGFMGSIQQNTNIGTITGLPTGMTAAISNNNSKNTSITFTVTTSMTTKSGQVTIPITMGTTTINKIFSYSLSLTGATGATGAAGTGSKYYGTRSWTNSQINNTFIIGYHSNSWTNSLKINIQVGDLLLLDVTNSTNNSKLTYILEATSGTTSGGSVGATVVSITKDGVDGSTGATGTGVSSIIEEYYLSDSKTTQSGGEWVTSPPQWEYGKYIWTRNKITYSNPESVSYTAPICSSEWEAVNNLSINTGNLWFNGQEQTSDSSQWTGNLIEVSYEDLPNSQDSYFKIRGAQTTKYYVPFEANKFYKIETWLKAIDSYKESTSNIYPSIVCYDMDKNSISLVDVMRLPASRTRLVQDLNPGDTIVYAEDLSGWDVVASSYYTYIGIYNYTSTSGYLYPNYTKNKINFADRNEDKNLYINKVNNTVTLKNAYEGDVIPAGTEISQHASGSAYYYPFSNIRYNTLAEWVKKEKIFSSASDPRFESTSYIRFYNYSNNAWYFGLNLTDVTNEETIKTTVKTVDVEYYLSNSNTTITGGSWSTTAPEWVDGKYMWSRQKVTYVDGSSETRNETCIAGATGASGNDGANAKVVHINPSSQIFKSTAGANGTFTPQYIYLYPSFQACTYGKWQYSTDGTTWTNVTSGSHSLTIATYNSIANSLRIERTCDLFTDSITAISFRCVSNEESIYDTVSIIKIYDTVDIEIGGRNLLLNSSFENDFSNWKFSSGTSGTIVEGYNGKGAQIVTSSGTIAPRQGITNTFSAGTTVTCSAKIKSVEGDIDQLLARFASTATLNLIDKKALRDDWFLCVYQYTFTRDTTLDNIVFGFYNTAGTFIFDDLKLETGNKPTDWTPALEDTTTKQTLQYTTTTTNTMPGSSAVWEISVPVSTEYYIWQRLQVAYDNGIIENSVPVCIYTPAIQISSIEEQYFIHTSDSTPPAQDSTSWLNEKPIWKDEYYQEATRRYLWVRTKYTYTGNIAKVEYSTPYYDPTWETISLLNKSIIDNAEMVENAINNGYVTIKDGYIEIRDNADPTKGILLSKEGISFKINGTTYTSVWSLDGTFNAQSILVKNLNASNILSGTLTLQEDRDNQENNGVFLLKNQSGTEVAKIDVNGLKITAIDGSYIYLRTGEDDNTKKGIYLVDAGGNIFVSTDTANGIFTVEKQIINDYQEFNESIRIISIGGRGIGFIGI